MREDLLGLHVVKQPAEDGGLYHGHQTVEDGVEAVAGSFRLDPELQHRSVRESKPQPVVEGARRREIDQQDQLHVEYVQGEGEVVDLPVKNSANTAGAIDTLSLPESASVSLESSSVSVSPR